ncbi:MAG: deoxyribonuclease V [Wenzhouxiangella sp.]
MRTRAAAEKRSVAELIAEQRRLAEQVITESRVPPQLTTVTGVDVAFPDRGQTTRAAAVTLSYPELAMIEHSIAELPTALPYIPGLLSFRELPALLAAIQQLQRPPELVLVDGQGLAHPRRFGVACHLGVVTGLCTIGVGKSRLCGEFCQPGACKGARSELRDGGEVIGKVVRTRDRVRPLFVSSGHQVNLDEAVEWVLACSRKYRLPEPIRWADRLAGQGN